MEDLALPEGALIADRYRVESLLGEGGMGRVYRAQDGVLERSVALKVMRPLGPLAVARFEREARVAAGLRHPSVVQVLGFGQLDEHQPFLALEFVAGRSLQAVLDEEGALSPRRVAQMMRPVLGALAEAHGAGVVHRDLKPENLVLQQAAGMADLVRLLDFGIAAIEGPEGERLTQTGLICGTPEFMAPEQALGHRVTPAADVWACGAVMFTLMSGAVPFTGETAPEVLVAVVRQKTPKLPSSVPAELRGLVEACLQKDPEARPADAAELLRALDRAVAPQATVVPAASAPRFDWRPVAGAAVGGLLLGLLLAPGEEAPPALAAQGIDAQIQAVDAARPAPDPLAVPNQLLEQSPKAALSWLEANPGVGGEGRLFLRSLARLRVGQVEAGAADLLAALGTRPELAEDPRVLPAALKAFPHRKGDALIPLLSGPLAKAAAPALESMASEGRYRTRWRAIETLEKAGLDTHAARLAALSKDVYADDCDARRRAVLRLEKLGDPRGLPAVRSVARGNVFKRHCFRDGELARIQRTLRKAKPTK